MTEGKGNPGGIGNVLRDAMKATRGATVTLDKLPAEPTGDDPPPYSFEYVMEQLNLLRMAVALFEQRLAARPEVWA